MACRLFPKGVSFRLAKLLTQVTRGNPLIIEWDRIVEKQKFMSYDHAIEMIQEVTTKKESKRKQKRWSLPYNTILLLEIVDIPLNSIWNLINEENIPKLYSTGFLEIWLADYTGLDAYGNIELFCVCPEELAGYYSRGIQKPYG